MREEKPDLFEAFREDHVLLGRGFHDLSVGLRAGDVGGAVAAARRLNQEAGAHIAFEETDFYPVLAGLLGEEAVRRFHDEHTQGCDTVRAILEAAADGELDEVLHARLLTQSERMESHIAECGDLFGAMGRIPQEQQAALLTRLLEWRHRRPRWTDFVAGSGKCPEARRP